MAAEEAEVGGAGSLPGTNWKSELQTGLIFPGGCGGSWFMVPRYPTNNEPLRTTGFPVHSPL